jgi:hypothetical protein
VSNSIIRPEKKKFSTHVSGSIQQVYPELQEGAGEVSSLHVDQFQAFENLLSEAELKVGLKARTSDHRKVFE